MNDIEYNLFRELSIGHLLIRCEEIRGEILSFRIHDPLLYTILIKEYHNLNHKIDEFDNLNKEKL
jgi:hypothetical protein